MTPDEFQDEIQALCGLCHSFGERGWCRATSGNFSLRLDPAHCLITQSGKEKSRLIPGDLMICDFDGQAIDSDCRPSAETPLHTCLYRMDNTIGAVLHTHSIASTLLSRHGGSQLRITGFEMQKALTGIASHEVEIVLRIYDNDQDMQALAGVIEKAWENGEFVVPGFLIRGHGLYAWGEDIEAAARHIDGFEFIFECLWQEKLAYPK